MIKFSEKAFCKTCHFTPDIKKCYYDQHQIIDDGVIIPKYQPPNYNLDSECFEGRSEK